MLILGVDPGLSGALALLDTDLHVVAVQDMPVHRTRGTKHEIDPVGLAGIIRDWAPEHAWIEIVGARPGQGVTSMFRFGLAVGLARGVLAAAGVPVSGVTPQEWRRLARAPDGKDGSRARAIQLFPAQADLFSRVKDDGRAEATLIAWAGHLTLTKSKNSG